MSSHVSGYTMFIPVAKSLSKIKIKKRGSRNNQIGFGTSVEIVSPTKQIVDQAKENLKRNRKEANLQGLPPTPGNVSLPKSGSKKAKITSPVLKKKAQAPKQKKGKTSFKKANIHERYKKI